MAARLWALHCYLCLCLCNSVQFCEHSSIHACSAWLYQNDFWIGCTHITSPSQLTANRPLLAYMHIVYFPWHDWCHGRQGNIAMKHYADNVTTMLTCAPFWVSSPQRFLSTETSTACLGLGRDILLRKQWFFSQSCLIFILSWLCFRNGYNCLYRWWFLA